MRRPVQNSNVNNPLRRLPNLKRRIRIWFIAAIMVLLGVLVMPYDLTFADPNNLKYLPGDLTRIVGLSEIFAHGYGVLVISAGIWFLVADKRRFIPRIVLCAFWPAAGVSLLKILFGRARPISYFTELSSAAYPTSIQETWVGWLPNAKLNAAYALQSFPSAHTATTWGLAIGMSFVFPKGRWLFWAIATLASIQRITSFAHWTSDVFFGAAIAVVMAGSLSQNWGFGYLLKKYEDRKLASSSEKEIFAEEDETERDIRIAA
jgi:membrane-associated phospholipid phosphatase